MASYQETVIPEDTTEIELKKVLARLVAERKITDIDVKEAFDAVRAECLKVATMVGVASTKMSSEFRLTLAETTKFLDGVIDIELVIKETLKLHEKWVLPQAFVQAGVVSKPSEYEKLLRTATTRKADLPKIKTIYESSDRQSVLIVPPLSEKFGLVQLSNVIFSRLPHYQDTFYLNNIGAARQIDPHDIPQLLELSDGNEAELQKVRQIWKEIYGKKSQLVQSDAHLLFTPDELEISSSGRSALKDMQIGLNGAHYLDLAAHWMYLIEQLTKGVEQLGGDGDFYKRLSVSFKNKSIDPFIPDTKKVICYSGMVLPDGSVPYFSWYPEARKFSWNCDFPDIANEDMGSRKAFG